MKTCWSNHSINFPIKKSKLHEYGRAYGVAFRAHEEFKKSDIQERSELYQKICEQIWNEEYWEQKIA